MSEPSIVCSHLSFAWPDDTAVFDDLSLSVGPGRTGLIAANGAGKSTLLRLIAGQLRPTGGTTTVCGTLGYLPQQLPYRGDLTVADALGIAPTLAALHAVEAGTGTEADFTAIGNDWDVEDRAAAELDRLGLADLGLNRRLETLSGGQIVTIGLAAALLTNPDVLLLDEPTNNLDRHARDRLETALLAWSGCLLLVSHDRSLLDRMQHIVELGTSTARLHGGNLSQYQQIVRAEQDAAQRAVRNAEQEVKRARRDQQQARERAARRSATAVRNLDSAGLPKIVAGALQRSAQESAGRADQVHAARVAAARDRLDDAERCVRDDRAITLDLPATEVPAGRTVLTCQGLQVAYGGRPVFADAGIDLVVRGPERIALVGGNGAGKTTLLRAINGDFGLTEADAGGREAGGREAGGREAAGRDVAGDLEPVVGGSRRVSGRIGYLSQRLDLLDAERSVLQNLTAFAPDLSSTRRMHLLAQFLFRGSRVDLPVRALSGGELLRATLACMLHAEPAPQLLLLDEPTNNLDLVSVEQLELALGAYRGALIVVSHDSRFLDALGVDRWLRLDQGRLR